MYSRAKIVRFGDPLGNAIPIYSSDPLSYCLGSNIYQRFNHGTPLVGQNSNACQIYMAQRCADCWDHICDKAYDDSKLNYDYVTRALTASSATITPIAGLSPGEILLLNTAHVKYLVSMSGDCQLKVEPFDPTNPFSPNISHYVGRYCVPSFAVKDPSNVDKDPVMNKLLDNPKIASQLLMNIYNTMKRMGTLYQLKGSRLGDYYKLSSSNVKTPSYDSVRNCGCPGCANAARL